MNLFLWFRPPRLICVIAGCMTVMLVMLAPEYVSGQVVDEDLARRMTLHFHLAYVRSGDPSADQLTHAGLTGLAQALHQRTSVTNTGVVGVDLERDELAFFALLYWIIPPEASAISSLARQRISRYLDRGGMIVFDGRGGNIQHLREYGFLGHTRLPALHQVPADHVLTRSFYLLSSFPGRHQGPVWVEAAARTDQDGVSSLVVSSNDWVGAWAIDQQGRPLLAAIPGGAQQREMAYRFGVNLVMYVLTGNYKSDQLHVATILERRARRTPEPGR